MLCLGPSAEIAVAQAVQALAAGCAAVVAAPGAEALAKPLVAADAPVAVRDGTIRPGVLRHSRGFAAVAAAGRSEWARELRLALAARPGAIVALETEVIAPVRYFVERHLCIDTTAAGGNASLLASAN